MADEWKKKLKYIYTKEYYSTTRKDEILFFAITRIKLKRAVLNKTSQKIKAR